MFCRTSRFSAESPAKHFTPFARRGKRKAWGNISLHSLAGGCGKRGETFHSIRLPGGKAEGVKWRTAREEYEPAMERLREDAAEFISLGSIPRPFGAPLSNSGIVFRTAKNNSVNRPRSYRVGSRGEAPGAPEAKSRIPRPSGRGGSFQSERLRMLVRSISVALNSTDSGRFPVAIQLRNNSTATSPCSRSGSTNVVSPCTSAPFQL